MWVIYKIPGDRPTVSMGRQMPGGYTNGTFYVELFRTGIADQALIREENVLARFDYDYQANEAMSKAANFFMPKLVQIDNELEQLERRMEDLNALREGLFEGYCLMVKGAAHADRS